MKMTQARPFTFLLVTSLLTLRCDAVSVEILTPVQTSGAEAGLIIVPGAFISGHAYRPLGEAIQANSTARLWVALLENFLLHLANPLQVGGAVDQAVSKFKAAGLTSDVIFIAGHSLGGGIVNQYVQSHSSRFRGSFFFGHFPDFTLSQFPLPAMTLSGDLDGLARLTHMVDKFTELSKDMATDSNALYRTPVLLIKGVNHARFASGTMPSTVQKNDLSADVNEATAHALIAPYISSFLSLHMLQISDDVTEAKARLRNYFKETREIYEPLMTTKALDENSAMASRTAYVAQSQVAGVAFTDNLTISDREVDDSDIHTQLPTIAQSGSTVAVSTVTHVSHDRSLFGQAYSPVSPRELQVKMISRDAILSALSRNGTAYPTLNNMHSCMSLNQYVLHLALSLSSPTARSRYMSRGSEMLVVTPDYATTDSASWLAKKLDFRQSASNVIVTSAVYRSPGSPDTPGVMFCKLLSPYRAMEWIYVDSLRPFGGSKSVFDKYHWLKS